MELGLQVVLVREHPGDEGLLLGVTLSSNVLEGQWPVSDFSTYQVWVPNQTPSPVSFTYDIMNLDLAEPPYHGLSNGDSNTLSLPGASMRTRLQTIERLQCQIRAVSMMQGKYHSNSGSIAY